MEVEIVLLLCGLIISIVAQIYVKVSYSKSKKIQVKSGLTGFDVAKKILENNGLEDMYIVETQGVLSDHYDPQRKTIRLSSEVYNGTTVASVSVAAHECGHAIQDKEGYGPMRIRSKIVPIVNISSYLGYFSILIGLFLGILDLIMIGIVAECIILLFQLITLPVEFNASSRAKVQLKNLGIVDTQEHAKCSKMLRAAAFTYVASLLTTILQVLRLLAMVNRRR